MNSILSQLCTPPSLETVKRALFIQPHPDDNEIGAGGTIAYLVDRGVEVYGLTATDDRFVVQEKSSDGLTIRQREAINAMNSLGVKNAGFLGFADKTRASIEEISAKILPIIRELKPDAVFSADPTLQNECHSDHIKVGLAVRYCVMDADCDFFPDEPGGKPRTDTWSVPILGQYYTENPNTVVDISKFKQKKHDAIACHVSQVSDRLFTWLDAMEEMQAEGTGFKVVERIKLLSRVHLHCFVYPVK
jgi:LmbE family N-acetylglucosaminyl deacetylase